MSLRISFSISKKWFIASILALIIIVASLFAVRSLSNKNPLPASIKNKVSYRLIYPSQASKTDQTSYKYLADNKILTFKVNQDGKTVVFTEQAAPASIGQDTQAYYPALGIHPYAQFGTKLGQVALTKFYQSGSLEPAGQSAILASNGTLLIANSQKDLTNAQWKDLFENLKITK